MKYLTLAVFLGVVSADALEEAMNALKITVHNGHELEKEWNDVEYVAHKIEHSRPVRNLQSSLERWFESKEALRIHELDKAFLASPEGKRLVAEWRDVGDVLEKSIYHNKTGIHINNDELVNIEDEFKDVEQQYKDLEDSKWDKAYTEAYTDFFTSKEHASVKRRAEAFKKSKEGQWLGKELKDFDNSLKKNVEVTDIPEDWKDNQMDLRIDVSKRGQAEIEKEFNDVKRVKKEIRHSRPVRNMKNSVRRWAESDEVEAIRELDKKFLASPRGKRLVAEWKDFGHALKKHVKKTRTGIHIDNQHGMNEITDELEDVGHQYEQLEKTRWAKAYDYRWKQALHNKEAKGVKRRWNNFEKSDEWHKLAKELHELDMSLKKNVKVSDVPEEWKDQQNDLKVTIHNQDDIEREWTDVENTWKKIEHSRPVRNLGGSLERWFESEEHERIEELDKKFLASPAGKRLVAEWSDVFETLDDAVYHNKKGFHIDNSEMQHLEDELDDVSDQYEKLEKTHWKPAYDKAYHDWFTNDEAHSVHRRAQAFKHSPQGHKLKKEVKEFKHTVKDNVEVTDIPEHWKKDMFLF